MHVVHDRDRLALPEQLAGIDLNLVVAFDALAREGSVTRAARRMGITQSAMSHALGRLRALLGDPLLVRTGSGMALTPRAEALVVPLRSGLVTLGRALLSSSAFVPAESRRAFCVAADDLFDALAMPPLLARVRAEAPGVDLKLVATRGQALSEKLETGEVDVAVVPRFEASKTAPPPPEGTGLVRRTLFHDRFACFVRADPPQAGPKRGRSRTSKRALDLERFVALSHLLVSPSGDAVGPVDEALTQRGLTRRIALSVPHFTSALAIIADSDLVLTAPRSLAGLIPHDRSVAVLPPPLALPEHSIGVMWHERFHGDAGHRWLRELLCEVARGVQRAGP